MASMATVSTLTKVQRLGFVVWLAGAVAGCGGNDSAVALDDDGASNNSDSSGNANSPSDGQDGPSDKPNGSGPQSSNNGSTGDNPGTTPTPAEVDPNIDWEALTIVYSPMYSAYDGVHTYSLPVYVNGVATEVEQWQAVPADAVSFSPWQNDDGSQVGVLVTVEQSVPEVTILASEGAIGGKATLYITDATPEQWEVGQERYVNGETFDPEAFMNDPELLAKFPQIIAMLEFDDNGNPVFTGTAADLGLSTDMRCDTCHTTGAENFQVQHTPTQVARFSDEELIHIFTEGMKPPGVGYRALPEMYQNFYEIMHTWNVSEEQVKGIVVYLRSLVPEGQGDILLPTGFFATEDIDFSKLPASCNPDGDNFDVALCLLELPPICSPLNLAYDRDACAEMLGIDLGGSSSASP